MEPILNRDRRRSIELPTRENIGDVTSGSPIKKLTQVTSIPVHYAKSIANPLAIAKEQGRKLSAPTLNQKQNPYITVQATPSRFNRQTQVAPPGINTHQRNLTTPPGINTHQRNLTTLPTLKPFEMKKMSLPQMVTNQSSHKLQLPFLAVSIPKKLTSHPEVKTMSRGNTSLPKTQEISPTLKTSIPLHGSTKTHSLDSALDITSNPAVSYLPTPRQAITFSDLYS